jgi:ketosteroid isomerase-like protein
MKYILLIFLLSQLHLHTAAQFSKGAKDSAILEIRQLTEEWNKAVKDRDSVTLDRLLAPEYTLNGSAQRSGWMDRTLHHFTTDTLVVLGELNISYYGQAAKSEGFFYWKASYDGNPTINAEYSIDDIWIKRNGQWQVLLRMSLLSKKR